VEVSIEVYKSTETSIDVFTVRDDGCEQLLASGLGARELADLQDWWRYTKPFGSGVKIVVRADSRTIAGFSTAGTEPGLAAETHHPEVFIS
jgi:hypothetical protein